LDAISFQLLFNGLVLGAGYGVLGLGFALTLRAAGAVNFAHGDVAAVAAYGGVTAVLFGATGVLAVGVAALVGGTLGLVVAAIAWAPLRQRPVESTFIAAIALGIVAQNSLTVGFGGAPRALPAILSGGWRLDGLYLSAHGIISLGMAIFAFTFTALLLLKSRFGMRLRVFAGILSGLAGAILSTQHYVTPAVGAIYILKAYIAATAAGWGRIFPTALIAVAIALFETIGAALFSHAVAEGVLYLAFLTLLVFRPEGLAGDVRGRRV
jgi:branched-chain amino acid transport system permease protein